MHHEDQLIVVIALMVICCHLQSISRQNFALRRHLVRSIESESTVREVEGLSPLGVEIASLPKVPGALGVSRLKL
jgi:hypothetical protein